MTKPEYEVLFDDYSNETVARIRLTSDGWNGIIYHYNTVKIKEAGDEAVLKFEYDIVETPAQINIEDLSPDDKYRLEKLIGDVLVDIIEECIHNEDRTNNPEQSYL
jgi:hypothetical protein